MRQESLKNVAMIETVETFGYGIVAGNPILKTEVKPKFNYRELLKFENEKLIESVYKDAYDEKSKTIYTYDDENCLIKIKRPTDVSTFTYCADEVEVSILTTDPSRFDEFYTYTLNHEGYIIKETQHYLDGDYSYCTRSYNEKKDLTYSDCGASVMNIKYSYDTNGNITKEIVKNINDEVRTVYYKYDLNKQLIENTNGNFRTVYKYADNLLTEEIIFIDNVKRYVWKYKYDKYGNWIDKRVFYRDVFKEYFIRKIKYKK